MLRSISLLRGLAALGVVVYHAIYFEGWGLYGEPLSLEAAAGRVSLCGVTTFFVLSGYLMARLVEREPFRRFAPRRLLRIYPAFLAATAIAMVAAAVGLLSLPDFPLEALTLLPVGEVQRPLGVEWTLVYEVFYYAVASIFCFRPLRRFFPLLVLVWTAVVLTAFLGFNEIGTRFQPTLSEIGLSIWNLGFLVGALSRFAERNGWTHPAWVIPGVALLALSEAWGLGLRAIFLPVGLGLIVHGVIAFESRRDGLDVPRWMLVIGDASYGIYLLHVPVIRSLVFQLDRWGETPPAGLVSLASVLLVLICTTPFGFFEHRFYDHAKRSLASGFRANGDGRPYRAARVRVGPEDGTTSAPSANPRLL